MYCLGIVWSREHEPLCWGSISTVVSALPKEFGAYTEPQGVLVASSPGHSQILSRSRGEKKLGEGLGSKLRHEPEMVDSVSM